MAFCDSKIMGCGSIRPQLIRDELVWDKAIFLQKVAHQFQRGTLVPQAARKSVPFNRRLLLAIQVPTKLIQKGLDFGWEQSVTGPPS
jgi:hypothetical protein